MIGQLILKSGQKFEGISFGAPKNISGELVFATGMVGYPESLTDPSYAGQILVMTYPLVGNYGVPDKKFWESEKIQVAGLVVSSYIEASHHHKSQQTLGQWLKKENIPALEVKDTRALAQTLAQKGATLGQITFDGQVGKFVDPDLENLVAKVSTKKVRRLGKGRQRVILIDCGVKGNIIRELVYRGVEAVVVPVTVSVPFTVVTSVMESPSVVLPSTLNVEAVVLERAGNSFQRLRRAAFQPLGQNSALRS